MNTVMMMMITVIVVVMMIMMISKWTSTSMPVFGMPRSASALSCGTGLAASP